MQDVYTRYPTVADNARRDRYLLQIAGAALDQVLSGAGDPRDLVGALRRAAQERRLLVYSADPDLQRQLAPFTIAGEVPDDARPYFAVTVNSAVPSKLDYYLDRSVAYMSTSCTARHRRGRLTVTLTNTAPARGLPDYVALPPGDRDVVALRGAPKGSNYVYLDLLLPQGAGLRKATVDGERVDVAVGRQRNHPVLTLDLVLKPGQTRTVTVQLIQPRSDQVPEIERQPLVRPLKVSQTQDPC
jgi:hypothetical protein